MNSQEYQENLEVTKNRVNLNYQMARVTIKENLSRFTNTQKNFLSQNLMSKDNQENILSERETLNGQFIQTGGVKVHPQTLANNQLSSLLPDPSNFCEEHERELECFCDDCKMLICPSCLMFGEHKGHEVKPIEQGYLGLKNRIEHMMDQRTLNVGNMRDRLVEVGHCKRVLEEKKNSLLLEIDEVFDQIFKIVKVRRNQLKGLKIV